MPFITLTDSEVRLAIQVGGLRRWTAIQEGLADKAGRPNDWTADIEGAAGEIAYCKFAGLYWPAGNKTFSEPDAGTGQREVEVKTAWNEELPIYPSIPDSRKVILVTGRIPAFKVIGWILAGDGKKLVRPSNKGKGYQDAHFVQGWQLHTYDPVTRLTV